jgi:CBS domain-containing protein/PII-like signaling protein
MDDTGVFQRVRFYLSEGDSWHHQPAPTAVLERLRREGCAGATIFKGIAGFGAQGKLRVAALVDVASPLPVVVEWVDTPERVQRLLPTLLEMVDGLVTVEEVRVVKQPHRALRDVPPRVLVRDVMTPADRVDVAAPDTPLRDLVALLLRRRRRAIPVLDPERRVVGIVTNLDLVRRAGLPLRLELLRALGERDEPAVAVHLAGLHGDGRTAGSIMTPEVVTVPPDLRLTDAADLMLARRLKRLPVVDPEGRLLGMLSRFDVLQTVTDVSSPSPAPESPPRPRPGRLTRRIGDVMNRAVPTVRPETPLPEVLDAVMATRLHRAVVVGEAGEPIGIVVDTDLMQRVTPAAHPGLVEVLMHRVRSTTPAQQEEWRLRTGQRAADVMRPAEQTLIVPEDADLVGVIDRMLARQVKLVAVTDAAGRLVGMADRADLLAALAAAV